MKRYKAILIPIIVVAVLVSGYLFVRAQFISDTFTDDSGLAATWNISTSTPGEIKMLEKTCDSVNWWCSASTTCANDMGDGDYIIVAREDSTTTKQWKTTETSCDRPICGMDGGQNGDVINESNIHDFSLYPARNYCKTIGARLPTTTELSCIYTNRAMFGNNFINGLYWTGVEINSGDSQVVNFSNGDVGSIYDGKNNYYPVRCVIGW